MSPRKENCCATETNKNRGFNYNSINITQITAIVSQHKSPIDFILSRKFASLTFIKKHTVPSNFRLFPIESCLKVKFNHFSFASFVYSVSKESQQNEILRRASAGF